MEEDLQKNALASLGDINGHILNLLKNEYSNINPEVKEAIFEWLSTLVQIVHEEFVIMDDVIEFVFKSAEIDDIIIDEEEDKNTQEGEDNLMKQEDEDAK